MRLVLKIEEVQYSPLERGSSTRHQAAFAASQGEEAKKEFCCKLYKSKESLDKSKQFVGNV